MSKSAEIKLNLIIRDEETDELSTLSDYLNKQYGVSFAQGVGANQINMIFHDQRALAKGANETLDFHDGSLTNKVNESITMDIFKVLIVKNNSTDSSLEVGGAATNALGLFKDASDIEVIPPSGHRLFFAPDASGVDCTTNAKLKIARTNEGADPDSMKYDLIALGVDTP